MPENRERIDGLFLEAVDLRPEERAGFLDSACAGDPTLRREVESLLAYDSTGDQLIATAIQDTAQSLLDRDVITGALLGSWRVLQVIGSGGMGTVYLATRADDQFQKRVAIKVVKRGMDTDELLSRFRRERQILANLDHPYIARLLDGGSTPDGRPFLAMEYVEGLPIDIYCSERALDLQQRCLLFIKVCEAVSYAHRNFVIHRDLKPGNILITADGTPKLLDCGVAKLLDSDFSANHTATVLASRPITPEYASPEQVRGESIGPASDIYALGAIFYELLSGAKAHQLASHSLPELERAICAAQIPPPSSRLDSANQRLRKLLSGDLDNIALMALRKEPQRRYASVDVLAEDIRRHLNGRTVIARRDSFAYRFAKYSRRNRVALVAASLVFSGLVAVLLLIPPPAPHLLHSTQLTHFGRAQSAAGAATDGKSIFFSEILGGHHTVDQVSVNGGEPVQLPLPLPNTEVFDISPDHSELLIGSFTGLDRADPLWAVPIAGGSPRRLGDAFASSAAWSPDGETIAFTKDDEICTIHRDGTLLRLIAHAPGPGEFTSVRWSPSGSVLRFSYMDAVSQTLSLWEVAADGSHLRPALTAPRTDPGRGEGFGSWTPDGRYFIYQFSDSTGTHLMARRESRGLFSLFIPKPVEIYSGPQIFFAPLPSTDGKRIFFIGDQERRELVRYETATRQFVPYLSGIFARSLNFSADAQQVASIHSPEFSLWVSRPDGSGARQLTPPTMHVFDSRFSPDGRTLAAIGGSGGRSGIFLVAADGSKPPEPLLTERDGGPIGWSADGQSLFLWQGISAHDSENLAIFALDVKSGQLSRLPGSDGLHHGNVSPDHRYIAALTERNRAVVIYDLQTHSRRELATGAVLSVPFWSHDGSEIFFQDILEGSDQPVYRVSIATRKTVRVTDFPHPFPADVLGYRLTGLAPDDSPLATLIRANSDLYALDVDFP